MSITKKAKGFTLIELMIVVAIIGILAAVAIPKFADLVTKSKEASVKGTLGSVRSAVSIYYGDNDGTYPGDIFVGLTTNNKYMPTVQGASSLGKFDIPKNGAGNPGNGNVNVTGNTLVATSGAIGSANDGANPLYYYNLPTSPSLGEVYINCTHNDTKMSIWSGY